MLSPGTCYHWSTLRPRRCGALLAAIAICSITRLAGADPRVAHTEVIGPLTGHDAKLDPENLQPPRIRYYGTDLGFTYQHGNQLVFLFGDTWATEAYEPIQASTHGKFDDSWGVIDLTRWPDPAKITPTNIPTIRLARNPGTDEVAAMNPGRAMDLSKTPLHGFSNGTQEFGVFLTAKPQGCAKNSDCGAELSCDVGLGYAGVPYSEETKDTYACVDGTPGCNADTMLDAAGKPEPHTGMCVDPTSHGGPASATTRINSVAQKVLIGVRSRRDPRVYENINDWLTNKFYNATVRTVQRFVPTVSGPPDADYGAAHGAGEGQRVFVWGRPGWVGVAAKNQPLNLYFGYADLPASGEFKWQLHYFTGLKNGVAQFSTAEHEAAPLDLDSSRAGVQPEEAHDIVNQMSVSWIAPLHKWVMFYGGGSSTLPLPPPLNSCGVLQLFAGADCKSVNMENGAVRMRTADNPWGPWSAAQDVLVGGDVAIADEQHGPGGVLYHPNCKGKTCATPTRSPFYKSNEYGFFYAANIIEQWTRPAGGGVDVLWDVSTWDPYRVVLVRTRIMP